MIPEDVRFWSKVRVGELSGCWEWTAAKDKDGYGLFRSASGKMVRAHRWAYSYCVRTLLNEERGDHLCRNHRCVNPHHIDPTSNKENILRGIGIPANNARKTHCKNGHPLSGSNLRIQSDGKKRLCVACYRKWKRERYRQKHPGIIFRPNRIKL